MIDTTIPVPLAIPESAYRAMMDKGDAPMREYVAAIAAPVVAAELRRLAADCHETALVLHGEAGFTATAEADALFGTARTLRARADELNGPETP